MPSRETIVSAYYKRFDALLKHFDYKLSKLWMYFSILPSCVFIGVILLDFLYFGRLLGLTVGLFTFFSLISASILKSSVDGLLSRLIEDFKISKLYSQLLQMPKIVLRILQVGKPNWLVRHRKLFRRAFYSSFLLIVIPPIFFIQLGFPSGFFSWIILGFLIGILLLVFSNAFSELSDAYNSCRFTPKGGIMVCVLSTAINLAKSIRDSTESNSVTTSHSSNEIRGQYVILLEEGYIYFKEYLSALDPLINTIKDLPLYFSNIYLILKYGNKSELENLSKILIDLLTNLSKDNIIEIARLLGRVKFVSSRIGKYSENIETAFKELKPIPYRESRLQKVTRTLEILGALSSLYVFFQILQLISSLML